MHPIRYYGQQFATPLAIFIWLTSVTARAAYLVFGESVRIWSLADTPNFNSLLAVSWGVFGLSLILIAKCRRGRINWVMGASVLALDAVKLLAIDLRFSPTIVRIIAFMLLGGLFILIGWLAPLPPRHQKEPDPKGQAPARNPGW